MPMVLGPVLGLARSRLQAALLMATFGPLTAKNIQSAMWRHAFTSQRLVLVGPGATKLLVQLVGLYRDFRPSGVSMATAWQLHDLLVQAQKAMRRATKNFTKLLPEAPELAERLVLWVKEDQALQDLMRVQFHCCETNKLLRAVFQAVEEAKEEDDVAWYVGDATWMCTVILGSIWNSLLVRTWQKTLKSVTSGHMNTSQDRSVQNTVKWCTCWPHVIFPGWHAKIVNFPFPGQICFYREGCFVGLRESIGPWF